MPRNGDGIFVRKDRPGFWISYQDAEGRRRKRKVEAPNRTEAGKLRSGYVSGQEKMKAHGVRPPGPETFSDVAQQYLAHQKRRISTANYERERGIVEDHLKPFFPGELRAIQRATVHRYITARLAEVANATAIKELNVLKHLCELAVNEWAVSTGMRRSEILKLRWLDVDLNGRRLLLPQTKNGEGRIVYLNRLALQAIESLPVSEKTKPTDVLFPGLDPPWVSVKFARVCRSLNIADFHLHDLRHTAASWMRMQGADIHTVAQLLGHKDLRMAARYQHLSPVFLADAVGRLDGVFGQELCPRNVPAPRALTAGVTASA